MTGWCEQGRLCECCVKKVGCEEGRLCDCWAKKGGYVTVG